MYMMKTLNNKLLLRQRFFILRMTEDMFVKFYLDNWLFSSLVIERIGDKIADEIKAMHLLCLLPTSYQNFKETFLYERSSITMEKVRSALLSKKMIDEEF